MLPTLLAGLGGPETQSLNPPFTGTHYAKTPIKGNVLHGDKRGQTGEGEESDRVFLPPRGAPAAVHVYENNGQLFGKHPQITARPHAYQVDGNFNLATIEDEPKWAEGKQVGTDLANQAGADPKTAELVGRNEAEWGLKEAGFHGYRSKSSPGNVVLFGDVSARSLDKAKSEEASANQPMLAANENPQAQVGGLPPSQTNQPKVKLAYPVTPANLHESHEANSDPAHLG